MNGQYNIGDIVLGKWKLTEVISEGAFGRLYAAERRTDKAAIKIITIPQSQSEVNNIMTSNGLDEQGASDYFHDIVKELVDKISLMSQMHGNRNIVSYKEHTVVKFTDGIGWDILIRMERLMPLSTYATQNEILKSNIIKLGIDMCQALELCREYNVVHGDIRPENIFISLKGDFKLGDFLVTQTVEKTTGVLSKEGTYDYIAPEVYRGALYSSSADIYSLGLVLYTMLNGNMLPFMPTYASSWKQKKHLEREREDAQNKRISGAVIPPPANADGRLTEVILKACAYALKDRYSSLGLLKNELEPILYRENIKEALRELKEKRANLIKDALVGVLCVGLARLFSILIASGMYYSTTNQFINNKAIFVTALGFITGGLYIACVIKDLYDTIAKIKENRKALRELEKKARDS